MAAVLDTHAAIWYVFIPKRLSHDALRVIRNSIQTGKPVYISAISLVEIIYVIERGRIPLEAIQRLEAGLKDSSSGLLVAPVDQDVAEAVRLVPGNVIPDMPDWIIAATAIHLACLSSVAIKESNLLASTRFGNNSRRKGPLAEELDNQHSQQRAFDCKLS